MALKIGEDQQVQMPMKTVASLISICVIGAWFAFSVIERLNVLETKSQLVEKDLESANEFIIGVPKGKMVSPQIQELFMLVEELYKTVEKLEKNQEMNMTNKVNIEFLSKQLEKTLTDVENLKDKVRKNGNGH
ncbi:Fibrinogen-like coiled coil protein [uncultured Mediterranean phage uvMED]|nr:Fibrinogen-like coiled coil protein [uncultured Mediterranean phage uvMED]BAR20315.1 Fibrinogen-like coiled coil protein [uncultured Mediterranean phage uvMED]|tara:strand:- start:278 stop:676 length:399 start_codon:yes stop_codon:yes gene_type:complete